MKLLRFWCFQKKVNKNNVVFRHNRKQELALQMLGSDARHILLRGGARCVSGDTVLDGHTKTIAELAREGRPVRVVTSHGVQWADAPFKKGVAELHKVVLENGRSATVTSDHRFWTSSGWQKLVDVSVGQSLSVSLQEFDAYRLQSNSGLSLLGSVASVQHYSQTALDYPGDYCFCRHQHGERLQPEEVGDLTYHASQHDVPEHNRAGNSSCQYELGNHKALVVPQEKEHTHSCQIFSRPSSTHGSTGLYCEERSSGRACAQTSELFQRLRQKHSIFEPHSNRHLLTGELEDSFRHQSCQCDDPYVYSSDVPCPSGYGMSKIVSITSATVQPYYTLHVPGCEHYFANGIMHHNSGKTVVLIEALLARAIAVPKSRHAIFRFRANSLKSITGPTGTLAFVISEVFPELESRIKHNKQDGYYQLPNGSEIWYGGLDDKDRVEKILGNEYATVYFNESSQIPWGSYNMALTRLAQNTDLRQKAYYDANPPSKTHWIYRVFHEGRDPDSKRPLANPNNYATMLMNPEDNKQNLDPKFLEELRTAPERQRKRFYDGQYGDAGDAALWTSELIDQQRILDASGLPDFVRIVVSVDPSGADDVEDTAADEIGVGVVALGVDGNAYVLEDLTLRGSPAEWGGVATSAYHRHEADCIVGESNYGGAMVRHVIQTASPGVPYKEVTATRGKHVRATPVSALFEQRKVFLVGRFQELEDEMLGMTTAGYMGSKSPNRLDWMVWGVTELFPHIIKHAKNEQNGIVGGKFRQPRVNVGYSKHKRSA